MRLIIGVLVLLVGLMVVGTDTTKSTEMTVGTVTTHHWCGYCPAASINGWTAR